MKAQLMTDFLATSWLILVQPSFLEISHWWYPLPDSFLNPSSTRWDYGLVIVTIINPGLDYDLLYISEDIFSRSGLGLTG